MAEAVFVSSGSAAVVDAFVNLAVRNQADGNTIGKTSDPYPDGNQILVRVAP
ncbi:MAG TPA: hypothetical protein VK457_15325 [Chloroflexota bacterium]|nr:hypothetical protein [Chloroflexota bacterium]